MFVWISSNSFPLKLLLVRTNQAELIILKRLIHGLNNVTRVRVEPRSCDRGRHKNDVFNRLCHAADLRYTGKGRTCRIFGHSRQKMRS